MSTTIKYKWRAARLGLSLFIYWLVGIGGAGIITSPQQFQSRESGWIILTMLSFVTVCMITERGEWKAWLRVVFLPIAWLAHAVFTIRVAASIGMVLYVTGKPHLIDRGVSFFASIPVLIFAMRRSRLFVTSVALSATRSISAKDANYIVCCRCGFEQWKGYTACQKCGVSFN